MFSDRKVLTLNSSTIKNYKNLYSFENESFISKYLRDQIIAMKCTKYIEKNDN